MHQVQFVDQPMAMSSQGSPPASFLFATPASAQKHLRVVEVVSVCKHRVDPCKIPSSGFTTSTTNKSSSDAPTCGSPEVFQVLRLVLSTQRPLYPRACVLSRFSRVQLFATPWTAAHQAPLSIGFSRQEYWSGLPCPPPQGNIPDPETEAASLKSPVVAGRFFTTSTTWEALYPLNNLINCVKVFIPFLQMRKLYPRELK